MDAADHNDRYEWEQHEKLCLLNQLLMVCRDYRVCHVGRRQEQRWDRVTALVRPKC